MIEPPEPEAATAAPPRLRRPLVLVGLMGAGKTSVGKRLAGLLGVGFTDSDHEIVEAAGMSIPEIFASLGEPAFRDGERRVIMRLLGERPGVLATGGGAFIEPRTRAEIRAHATSVWLKADLDLLWDRVRDRPGRPLLRTPNPRATLADLLDRRYPVYAEADVTVDSRRGASHEAMARTIIAAVQAHDLAPPGQPADAGGRAVTVTVPVPLGARAYGIRIGEGLLARAGAEIAPLLRRPRLAVVTEATVAALHLPALEAALAAAGIEAPTLVLDAGEGTKGWARPRAHRRMR